MPEMELPETPETPESHKERLVGLIIAAIAVVLAIVSHLGNEIQKEEVLAHIDATDQYDFYQAKKARILQLTGENNLTALVRGGLPAGSQPLADQIDARNQSEIAHLAGDSEKIKEVADDHVREAHLLAAKASVIDIGEIALQIAVVLCSITILTEQSLFVRLGVTAAILGVLVAAWALVFMR